jgi:hypothetical protein
MPVPYPSDLNPITTALDELMTAVDTIGVVELPGYIAGKYEIQVFQGNLPGSHNSSRGGSGQVQLEGRVVFG